MKKICLVITLLLTELIFGAKYDNNGVQPLMFSSEVTTQSSAGVPVSTLVDPGMIFFNPAMGLKNSPRPLASISYFNSIADSKFGNFKFLYPFTNHYYGIQFFNFSASDYEYRDTPGEALHTFDPQSLLLSFSYGFKVSSDLYFGLAYKYTFEDINEDRYMTSTFDFGCFDNNFFIKGLEAGLSVQNLGINHNNDDIEIPLDIYNSFVYNYEVPAYQLILKPGISSKYYIETKEYELNSAISVNYDNQLELRAGYRFNKDGNPFSVGFGYQWQNFTVNYSYSPFSEDFNDSHGLNLIYSFDRID